MARCPTGNLSPPSRCCRYRNRIDDPSCLRIPREEQITLRNSGTANLVIGSVAQADPLALPFSLQADTCSGQTLAPNATCTIITRYAPTLQGDFSDTFDIPTNAVPATLTISLHSGEKPFSWTMFLPAFTKKK